MSTKKTYKVTDKKDVINLTDREYKASGGQGLVFCKGDMAYKIYHDPKRMIPVAKIQELSLLNRDNILAPIDPLYDFKTQKPIGFTMRYIKDIEFLCQIFTRTFRDSKGVSPTDIIALVSEMQKTLQYIHGLKYLVVDYNEMNFLLDKLISTVYHIDVDSWQTSSFKADAIMDSVRDRTTKPGEFSELSDWFSWAVVTFQMYTGIHPYKGRHKDFKPAEWGKRMDLGVSVFDSGVKLPPACQDFSLIPKRHLEWYKAVFMKNERSIPPMADDVFIATVMRQVSSRGDFIVKKLIQMKYSSIRSLFYLNHKRFIITSEGIYDYSGTMLFPVLKSAITGMCNVFAEDPLVAEFLGGKVKFSNLKGDVVSETEAEDMMGYNGLIYTVNNGQLIENSFERLGKLIHVTKNVCDISRSYKVFRGLITQDDFMKCRLAIPFEKGMCVNIAINELDNHRIIDARYDKRICIIIAEENNKYLRYILCFNEQHTDYTIRKEEIIDLHPANFIVLPNRFCIALDDEKLSIFVDNNKRKEMTSCPFDASMRLYNEESQVLFTDGKTLYSVTMK